MVLKVARQPEEALLALTALCPSYISRNTEIGRVECEKFFPPGYVVSSETGEPVEPAPGEQEETSKKKKKKKKKGAVDTDEVENTAEAATSEPAAVEQEESEQGDAEDDGDDEDEEAADGEKTEEH